MRRRELFVQNQHTASISIMMENIRRKILIWKYVKLLLIFCQGSEMVQYKVIEQVDEAVCILHKGPYDRFREAYTFVYQWIKDNGYEAIDNPRESYIDGIWNKNDQKDWLTEIQVPIKK